MRYEITGQRHQVGMEILRQPHRAFQARLIHIRAKMDVGDLGDAEAFKRFGQPRQLHSNVFRHRVAGFPEKAFNSEPSTGQSSQPDD